MHYGPKVSSHSCHEAFCPAAAIAEMTTFFIYQSGLAKKGTDGKLEQRQSENNR